jgi:nitrite reductase/ring-hydroxylating ferredoxin subunit
MTYHALEKIQNILEGYRRSFDIHGEPLLLLKHQGSLYLVENICPHAAYPMSDAKIIDSNLRCGMHGYLFSLQTGACTYYTEGPCRGLKTYQLVYKGDEVGVEI